MTETAGAVESRCKREREPSERAGARADFFGFLDPTAVEAASRRARGVQEHLTVGTGWAIG